EKLMNECSWEGVDGSGYCTERAVMVSTLPGAPARATRAGRPPVVPATAGNSGWSGERRSAQRGVVQCAQLLVDVRERGGHVRDPESGQSFGVHPDVGLRVLAGVEEVDAPGQTGHWSSIQTFQIKPGSSLIDSAR